jgi:hypothetical protein
MTMVWLWAPTTVEVTEKSDRGGVGVGDAVGEAVGTPEVAVLVAEGVPVPAGGDVGVLVGRDVGVFPGGDVGVFSGGEVGVAADPESLLSSSPHPATFNAAGAAATAMAKRIKNSLRSMYDLLCSRCLSTPLVIPGAIDQGGSTSLANMARLTCMRRRASARCRRAPNVGQIPHPGALRPGWSTKTLPAVLGEEGTRHSGTVAANCRSWRSSSLAARKRPLDDNVATGGMSTSAARSFVNVSGCVDNACRQTDPDNFHKGGHLQKRGPVEAGRSRSRACEDREIRPNRASVQP